MLLSWACWKLSR